jgi:hypothetical protein
MQWIGPDSACGTRIEKIRQLCKKYFQILSKRVVDFEQK